MLHKKHCVPCEDGVPPLKGKLLKKYMNQVNGWKLQKGKSIMKEYKFKSDVDALSFLDKIGKIAVREGHHPNATWVYNRVNIELWTHAIGGLSTNDFILASKFDRVYKK